MAFKSESDQAYDDYAYRFSFEDHAKALRNWSNSFKEYAENNYQTPSTEVYAYMHAFLKFYAKILEQAVEEDGNSSS